MMAVCDRDGAAERAGGDRKKTTAKRQSRGCGFSSLHSEHGIFLKTVCAEVFAAHSILTAPFNDRRKSMVSSIFYCLFVACRGASIPRAHKPRSLCSHDGSLCAKTSPA